MKKLKFLVLLAAVAVLSLPSKISAEGVPASYMPHVKIFEYQTLKNGRILVNICWDNIPESFDPNGIITVTGNNILEVEGGKTGIKTMHNTTDNIHFIISKRDESLLKLVYGKPTTTTDATGKTYTVVKSWLFKIGS